MYEAPCDRIRNGSVGDWISMSLWLMISLNRPEPVVGPAMSA